MSQSELFTLILDRPGLYIGHGSVIRAKLFLDGYTFGRGEADVLYKGFNDWVANRFSVRTAHDWGSIISFIGYGEAQSFALAKELWEEYKAEMIEPQNDRE